MKQSYQIQASNFKRMQSKLPFKRSSSQPEAKPESPKELKARSTPSEKSWEGDDEGQLSGNPNHHDQLKNL